MITEKINSVDRKIKEGADKLYDQADEARREGKDFAQNMASEAEAGLSQVKDTLERSWTRAKKASHDVEEKLAEYSKEGWKSVQSFAEKHPVQVAAMALAVGIVIGGALFSSSKE